VCRQAGFAFDLGEFQEAHQLAEQAIEIAEPVHAIDVIVQVYSTLPMTLARQGQFEQAIEAAQTGIELSQQVGDRAGEGQLYNDLGLILIEQKDHNQARDYFEKSLLIAQETNNRRLEAQVLNNMGKISGMIENDYVASRRFFEQALEIVIEIGNRTGEGYVLGNLGWAASVAGDFEHARSYFTERLTVSRESGNRYLEMYGMINLGSMLVTQQIYSEALVYTEQSLILARNLKDRSAEAWALTFLGFAHLGAGNLSEARDQFQTAYDIRVSLEQNTLAMEPLAGLAQVELDRDHPAAALVFTDRILSYQAEGGNLEGTEEPLRIYLTVYLTLMANQDPRAGEVLDHAHFQLMEQVGKIQVQADKDIFINNVPWRRKIEELWRQKQSANQREA
jgi:tetratricopeptide (TPR) repeat protein